MLLTKCAHALGRKKCIGAVSAIGRTLMRVLALFTSLISTQSHIPPSVSIREHLWILLML
jgi:hypothetical protein